MGPFSVWQPRTLCQVYLCPWSLTLEHELLRTGRYEGRASSRGAIKAGLGLWLEVGWGVRCGTALCAEALGTVSLYSLPLQGSQVF